MFQAIQAATISMARTFEMRNKLGSIKKGKEALKLNGVEINANTSIKQDKTVIYRLKNN